MEGCQWYRGFADQFEQIAILSVWLLFGDPFNVSVFLQSALDEGFIDPADPAVVAERKRVRQEGKLSVSIT